MLLGTGLVAFLFPQIRKSFGDRQTATVSNTTNLPTDPSYPVQQSGTNDSGTVQASIAPATKPTDAPTSNNLAEPPANQSVEPPARVEAAAVPEKGIVDSTSDSEPESRTQPSSDNRVSDAPEDKHESSATTLPHSGTRARKQRAVSRAVKLKQQTVAEEEPRPAPLSVETNRSRGVLSPPVGAATEVPSTQPPPLSIISGKPKPKVIQWP
jgi:hypothetical protein